MFKLRSLFHRMLLISLVGLGTSFWTGSLQAAELPGRFSPLIENAAPQSSALAVQPDLTPVKQGYELLLDRYVQTLSPGALLSAAFEGVVKGLRESSVTVKAPAPPVFDDDRDKAFERFSAALNNLMRESSPPEGFSVSGASLDAMARSVDEAHTQYMTPDQYRDFVAFLRGDRRYVGIGIGVRLRRPYILVTEVFPGSPAERAGLLVGDLIRKVNEQPIAELTVEQVAQLIRGPEGSTVVLEVDRPKTGERLSRPIVRASIKVEYVSTEIVQDNIGYVRLRGFPEPSVAERFERFLDELAAVHPRGLVIDLRGNLGGRVDVGVELLNRFISSGPLFDQVDRAGQHRVEQARGPSWSTRVPIAILIDEGTASMGEIFASAMRENGLARLFGNRTSGNVAMAQVYPLSDGSAMQVTILEVYSGKGALLNRTGVAPDVYLASSPEEAEQGRDIPLEAAVLYCWSTSQDKLSAGQAP